MERLQFAEYDAHHGVRAKLVEQLKEFTKGWDLNICIGITRSFRFDFISALYKCYIGCYL